MFEPFEVCFVKKKGFFCKKETKNVNVLGKIK